jgi:5-methylcytosine-specific restriction endonuclease McrA
VTTDFYSSRTWHKLRAKVKSSWRSTGRPCAYCNKPLDWGSKNAVIVDHVLNRRKHPHLALEPSNLVCLHHVCNTRKAQWQENSSKPTVNIDGFPDGWR